MILVPRLMTGYWQRSLLRKCDLYFQIDLVGFGLWMHDQFEPLIVFVCLPYRSNKPSALRSDPIMENVLGKLHGRELWEGTTERSGSVLRQLFTRASWLGSM